MARDEADNLKRIDLRWLKKHGCLCGCKSSSIQWKNNWSERIDSIGVEISIAGANSYMRFCYSQTEYDGEKKDFDYKARLVSSNCNYGGKRWWFICPLVKNDVPCNRRVRILYKNGDYFGCRHCYKLTYKSKNENRKSKYYYLFRIMDTHQKVDDMQDRIKRNYYGGKPTKKFAKLIDMFEKSMPYYDLLRKGKGL